MWSGECCWDQTISPPKQFWGTVWSRGLEVLGPWVTWHLEPLSFSRPLIQFFTRVARPCKDAIQVQPLLGINKARNILLHGISAPASAAPAVPTHPTAGSLSAFLPGCSSRTQRGAATLARPLASASGIATTSRIAATLVTRPGEDAGVLGGAGRGGAQARAFAWVPSELGTHGEKSYCKLWGVPSLSGAALSLRSRT